MTTTIENPHTALVRAALASGVSAGEHSLLALAKDTDDTQLAVIVGELPADDILALALEADITKVSMVHLFATPDQMLAAFERIGSNWSQLAKVPCAEDYLIRRQDIEDFLCPMMFGTSDEARAKEMMRAFLTKEYAIDALYFLGIGQNGREQLLTQAATSPFARDSWQQLWEIAFELQPRARTTMRAHFQTTLESTKDEDGRFARDILNELQRVAASHQPEPIVSEDEFVDI
jgi:hypothetical protein